MSTTPNLRRPRLKKVRVPPRNSAAPTATQAYVTLGLLRRYLTAKFNCRGEQTRVASLSWTEVIDRSILQDQLLLRPGWHSRTNRICCPSALSSDSETLQQLRPKSGRGARLQVVLARWSKRSSAPSKLALVTVVIAIRNRLTATFDCGLGLVGRMLGNVGVKGKADHGPKRGASASTPMLASVRRLRRSNCQRPVRDHLIVVPIIVDEGRA